jgi:selenocysteine lyase/cysteine desulfurase
MRDLRIGRRAVLGAGIALPVGHAAAAMARVAAAPADTDEIFWKGIAAQYDVPSDVIQLENGNWGAMPRPVLAEYLRLVERVNRDTSYYARRGLVGDLIAAKADLAVEMGVPAEDVALTRNATEALKALILGYNRLKPGDAVLYADLDYDSMQACMESLHARRGVTVIKIALPEPATRQSLVAAYTAAFDANPRMRLVLLTHLSHRTGLVIPVREIAAAARARGIDTIVDAAHSWGQLDFALSDLACDFIGLNCHKWLGNPLGVGAMYVRRSALDRIDPDPANDATMRDGVQSRVHTGTVDFAAQLTLPAALRFQRSIGAGRRAARLNMLRDRWVGRVRRLSQIEVLTPDDAELHGGITSFRLHGVPSDAANAALARQLLEKYRIFTVYRSGVMRGSCVRVTPGLFNSAEQMDALAAAIEDIASKPSRV